MPRNNFLFLRLLQRHGCFHCKFNSSSKRNSTVCRSFEGPLHLVQQSWLQWETWIQSLRRCFFSSWSTSCSASCDSKFVQAQWFWMLKTRDSPSPILRSFGTASFGAFTAGASQQDLQQQQQPGVCEICVLAIFSYTTLGLRHPSQHCFCSPLIKSNFAKTWSSLKTCASLAKRTLHFPNIFHELERDRQRKQKGTSKTLSLEFFWHPMAAAWLGFLGSCFLLTSLRWLDWICICCMCVALRIFSCNMFHCQNINFAPLCVWWFCVRSGHFMGSPPPAMGNTLQIL